MISIRYTGDQSEVMRGQPEGRVANVALPWDLGRADTTQPPRQVAGRDIHAYREDSISRPSLWDFLQFTWCVTCFITATKCGAKVTQGRKHFFRLTVEGQSVVAGKTRRCEHEAERHIVPTGREQREMNAGTLSPPFLFIPRPQTMGWRCPHLGEFFPLQLTQ